MKKPYIRVTSKTKRMRDQLAARMQCGKEEALEKALMVALKHEANVAQLLRRSQEKGFKPSGAEFQGGFFG